VIPLRRHDLRTSQNELARAIEAELRRFVRKTGTIVDVRSRVFPYIDEIVIDLDGAEIERPIEPRPVIRGPIKPAFEVARIHVNARNVRFRGTPFDLRLDAGGAFLAQASDANGEIVLLPRRIGDGEICLSAAQIDLERAIASLITERARPHGITIEEVHLALRQRGSRSISGELQIQARKFVRAKIEIFGELDVDERFVVTISHLRCHGTGAIARRACGALEPHLQRFDGRSFSLNSLPLGQTRLHDLHIAVTDRVELRLGLGTAKVET
jgi:hypothetical protein